MKQEKTNNLEHWYCEQSSSMSSVKLIKMCLTSFLNYLSNQIQLRKEEEQQFDTKLGKHLRKIILDYYQQIYRKAKQDKLKLQSVFDQLTLYDKELSYLIDKVINILAQKQRKKEEVTDKIQSIMKQKEQVFQSKRKLSGQMNQLQKKIYFNRLGKVYQFKSQTLKKTPQWYEELRIIQTNYSQLQRYDYEKDQTLKRVKSYENILGDVYSNQTQNLIKKVNFYNEISRNFNTSNIEQKLDSQKILSLSQSEDSNEFNEMLKCKESLNYVGSKSLFVYGNIQQIIKQQSSCQEDMRIL